MSWSCALLHYSVAVAACSSFNVKCTIMHFVSLFKYPRGRWWDLTTACLYLILHSVSGVTHRVWCWGSGFSICYRACLHLLWPDPAAALEVPVKHRVLFNQTILTWLHYHFVFALISAYWKLLLKLGVVVAAQIFYVLQKRLLIDRPGRVQTVCLWDDGNVNLLWNTRHN